MKYLMKFENKDHVSKYKIGDYVYLIADIKKNNIKKYKITNIDKAQYFNWYMIEGWISWFEENEIISVEEYEFQQDIKNFNL